MKWSMFPEVESAWAQVQGLFLGVIVPGLVGLFVAIITIVMALRWVHKASREGRHAGGSWEGAGHYADTHFDVGWEGNGPDGSIDETDGNDYWDDRD